MRILLEQLAFARPGDKGDDSDITVFARSEAAYAVLADLLTADRVADLYGNMVRGEVSRWEVPKVLALKFLLRGALGGGGPSSLRADNLGKALAGAVLRLPLDVPDDVAAAHPPTAPPTDPYGRADWTVR